MVFQGSMKKRETGKRGVSQKNFGIIKIKNVKRKVTRKTNRITR